MSIKVLLSGVKDKLEEADTIYKIFNLLGEECANYQIYQSIQDKEMSTVRTLNILSDSRLTLINTRSNNFLMLIPNWRS